MSAVSSKVEQSLFQLPTQAEINAMSFQEYSALRKKILAPVAEDTSQLLDKEDELRKVGGDCKYQEERLKANTLEIKKCQEEIDKLNASLPEKFRKVTYEKMCSTEFRAQNSDVTGEMAVIKLKIIKQEASRGEYIKFFKMDEDVVKNRDRLREEIRALKEKTAPYDKIVKELKEMWNKRPASENKNQTTTQAKVNKP